MNKISKDQSHSEQLLYSEILTMEPSLSHRHHNSNAALDQHWVFIRNAIATPAMERQRRRACNEFLQKFVQARNSITLSLFFVVCLMGLVGCSTGPRNLVMKPQGELIVASNGTPQSHTVNGAFAVPLVVIVTVNGSPASGVVVTFSAPTSGASGKFADTDTTTSTATTDTNGLATSAVFTANGTVGAYTVRASAQGTQTGVIFSLTNTTGVPASILATSGISQSAGVDSTFAAPLIVKVVDTSQNPVQFAIVIFNASASGASATFADTGTNATSVTTDVNGVATSTTFTANAIAGSDSVAATVAGVSTPATFTLANLAGPPATITATTGTPQKAAIGTTFSSPVVATSFNNISNPVTGATVTFNAPTSSASGTFSNGTTTETDVTDANGLASSSVFTANSIAGGPYTVTAKLAGAAAPATFSLTNTLGFKTYVFCVSGAELNTFSFYSLVGAVQIDTSGNVLAGEQDYNDGGYGVASLEPSGDLITGGAMQVSATTGQGTLVLNTNNPSLGVGGTETFAIQFVNAKHALISQFDGTATSSGSMDVQTLPAALGGGYAFTLTGIDPNFLPVAFGGVFTVSAGTTIQGGLLDTNDEGSVTTGSALTGTLSTPDSFGRGTINSTINYTALVGSDAPVALNYYIVGPEVLRIIDVDNQINGSATSDSAIGSAFGQGVNATASGNASVGTSVFGIGGNMLSQFAAAGMFTTTSSSASFSGVADDDELTNGVLVTASPISGNYSVSTNGYGSLTITSGSLGDVNLLGIYLTDPNLNLSDPNNTSAGFGGALVADMDGFLSGGTGTLIPQTDISTAEFTGAYAFGGQSFTSFGEFDFVGSGKVTKGAVAGTGLVSDPFLTFGAQPMNTTVKFGGTPLADPSNLGRYTMSLTNAKPNPLRVTINGKTSKFDMAIYQASGGQLLWLNEDSTSVFLGALQQQESLSEVPAITCCDSSSKK